MQVRVAPAKEGWLWIKQGWLIFRRQPMGLTAALTSYVFAMLVVGQIVALLDGGTAAGRASGIVGKILGGLVAAAFAATVPGITAGFMQACKLALEKKPIRIRVLIEPFREPRTRRNLLTLGFVQVAALVLVVAISPDFAPAFPPNSAPGLVAGSSPDPAPTNPQHESSPSPSSPSSDSSAPTMHGATPAAGEKAPSPNPAPRGAARGESTQKLASPARAFPNSEQVLAERKSALFAALVQMLLYLPVTVALWYAPMLVYWHGLPPGKSMFFSAAAIWRNRGAFAVYALALALCLFVAAYGVAALMGLLSVLLGAGKFSLILLAPFMLLLFTWFYCTIYVSYTAVFAGQPDAVDERETAPIA